MSRPVGSKNKTQEGVTNLSEIVIPAVYEAQKNVPHGTIEPVKEKVRQFSTNKDHKGEGEPLCFNCGHRADMHYTEHRWTERRMAKNLQGDIGELEIPYRKPVYDGARPCQHACKCTGYE